MQPSSKDLPVIRLMLGDDFESIQRRSTYRFPRRELGRIDAIAVGEPVVLEYTRPGCSFTLPPARSFAAAVDDNHAVSVTVSPQLKYLALNQALELTDQINQLLKDTNWKHSKRYITHEQIRKRLEAPGQDSDITVRLDAWKYNDDEIYIELARHWRKDESLPKLSGRTDDLCVVSMKIENDQVRAQYPGR